MRNTLRSHGVKYVASYEAEVEQVKFEAGE